MATWQFIILIIALMGNGYGMYVIHKDLVFLRAEKLLKLIEKVGEWV
jgi:hypothetical protein